MEICRAELGEVELFTVRLTTEQDTARLFRAHQQGPTAVNVKKKKEVENLCSFHGVDWIEMWRWDEGLKHPE